jgi:hypothetical protein
MSSKKTTKKGPLRAELIEKAKKKGIVGYSRMTKDQLVAALKAPAPKKAAAKGAKAKGATKKAKSPPKKATKGVAKGAKKVAPGTKYVVITFGDGLSHVSAIFNTKLEAVSFGALLEEELRGTDAKIATAKIMKSWQPSKGDTFAFEDNGKEGTIIQVINIARLEKESLAELKGYQSR